VTTGSEDDAAYLERVLAEIDDEVRQRRAAGDLPVRLERELDELFLEYSPVAGRGGGLAEQLRMVDAAAFIDPVVPVESTKSGGAAVKKTLRSLSMWYVGYVTGQVSQFASAVSKTLHLLDEQVRALSAQLDSQHVVPAEIVELPAVHAPDAWWVKEVVTAFGTVEGRVLHAAAGSGWLVGALVDGGVDAYGVEPRPGLVGEAEFGSLDLREEGILAHLRAVEPAALGGVVLSGVVDGMSHGEREQLLDLVVEALPPGGVLAVHSLSGAAWEAPDAPPEADLSTGHPLRPATWVHLLGRMGGTARVAEGPTGLDYLVVATLGDSVPPPR